VAKKTCVFEIVRRSRPCYDTMKIQIWHLTCPNDLANTWLSYASPVLSEILDPPLFLYARVYTGRIMVEWCLSIRLSLSLKFSTYFIIKPKLAM
jgi:hypothetical protein